MNCSKTGPLKGVVGPRTACHGVARGKAGSSPEPLSPERPLSAHEPPDRPSRRTKQRIPTPAAKPLGAVVAALGVMLLLIACSTSELPWYWRENAPALWGLAGGALIACGMLTCYLRFTLRFFLLAVAIVGCSGLLSSVCGCFKSETTMEYFHGCTKELDLMIGTGLIETLEQEGIMQRFPRPISLETGYKYCRIHFRPHVDQRVTKLPDAMWEFCDAVFHYDFHLDGNPAGLIERYITAIRVRFGAKAAGAVARRSAELAPTAVMRNCLLEQAQRLQRNRRGAFVIYR